MPKIGQGPNGLPNNFRKGECNFMRIPEDVGNPMDDASPAGLNDTSHDFRRQSELSSAEATNSDTNNMGEQSSWMPLPDHAATDMGNAVQQNFQDLALGEAYRITAYGTVLNSTRVGTSESSNGAMSPDTTHPSSTRPTPNASTPSDSRSTKQHGHSEQTSYETSPTATGLPKHLPGSDTRTIPFFANQPDYNSGPSATGMALGNGLGLPDPSGRDFDVPCAWDMGNQATTGLTPIGEGVFKHLLDLGPMDAMQVTLSRPSPCRDPC